MNLISKIFILILTAFVFSSCGSDKDSSQSEQAVSEESQSMGKSETELRSMPAGERPLAQLPAHERADYFDSEPEMVIDESKMYMATVRTEKGDITMQLNATYAPLHVNNFVFLSQQGFYDGLTFHRVIPGFVAQGGDPLGAGNGGPGYTIPAEFGLPHDQGAVAMARRPDQVNPEKRSSGSQFYITLAPQHQLDGEYSVFGNVTEGFEVAQQLKVGDLITRIDIVEK